MFWWCSQIFTVVLRSSQDVLWCSYSDVARVFSGLSHYILRIPWWIWWVSSIDVSRRSQNVFQMFSNVRQMLWGYSKDVLWLVSLYPKDTLVGLVCLVGLSSLEGLVSRVSLVCLTSLMGLLALVGLVYPWVWWILRVLWFKTWIISCRNFQAFSLA